MGLDIKEWETLKKEVGKAYYFKEKGRFHAILETKKGAFRGNHIHPNSQHTLLLLGKGKYVVDTDKGQVESQLKQGETLKVESGVPHILIPETDIVTFEWWDGDFISEPCGDIFSELTKERIGNEDPE